VRRPSGAAEPRRAAAALTALVCIALGACGAGSAPDDAPRSFYGVQPQSNPDAEDYARMAEAGVDTYRLFISWRAHDTAPGESIDFSALDDVFVNLAFNDIQPLPYVAGVPAWLTEDPHADPVRTERERSALDRFMRALAHRYGRGGTLWSQLEASKLDVEPKPPRTWEIWNEQNSSFYWEPRPSVEDYATLVEICANAIRSEDPSARIMTGGMFGTPPEPGSIDAWTFIRRLLANPRVRSLVDVVGVHPYSQSIEGVEAQLERTRRAIDAAGADGMPMHVSEIGWGSADGGGFKKGLEGQAEMLERTFELASGQREELGIEGVIWFTWRDGLFSDDTFNSSSGLLASDGEEKPSFDRFVDATGGE
jgi:hypothetical protein